VIAEPLWAPDLLVACSVLAGATLPADITFDGKDPLPTLTGDAPSPHRSFYFAYAGHAALRKGDWKIVREKPAQPWQLYNLAEDLSETHDLADTHPQRIEELQREWAWWEASF
jgi:arylsulfatase A